MMILYSVHTLNHITNPRQTNNFIVGYQNKWDEAADPGHGGWTDERGENPTGKWCTNSWYKSRFSKN